ncbi:TetR/AcrR family transcriptional regulator [Niveibacterium sp. SC-1]|uniref:TetR/AcrR family transcriptional regulator n=1 Tax=Niveibacterium sp. SC-1 TaxID=3135646 RepID=UPI00311ED194
MNAAPTTPDVREHILATAHPLLLARGFTAVGLAEVLSAAAVPKGSFYHYFASKEAFGEALLERYFAGYLAHAEALLNGPGNAAQRLLAYFEDWQDSQTGDEARSRCPVVKLGAEVSDLSEIMRAALQRGTGRVTARITRCIAEGQVDGSLAHLAAAESDQLGRTLYQDWLGASLLAKILRDRAPLDTAMANTRTLLNLD